MQVSERLIDDLPHGEVVALGLGEGGDHTVQTVSWALYLRPRENSKNVVFDFVLGFSSLKSNKLFSLQAKTLSFYTTKTITFKNNVFTSAAPHTIAHRPRSATLSANSLATARRVCLDPKTVTPKWRGWPCNPCPGKGEHRPQPLAELRGGRGVPVVSVRVRARLRLGLGL